MSRHLFLVLILSILTLTAFPQVKVCSWNLKDFGRTKSDEEIAFIANTISGFDVVAIQEVVAKDPGGAQAVARLADALNRKGSKWDYAVSNITSSSAYKAERYAFLWKPSKLTLAGKPWLETRYELQIDREPFFASFRYGTKTFTLVNFHAITKSRQPETEIKYFKYLPAVYPALTLVFCGDFNCPQSHTVFNPLKSMQYQPAFTNQKTSLRQKCPTNDCLASEFDNFFYPAAIIGKKASGIMEFYHSCVSFGDALNVSDHVPIWMELEMK